MRPAGRGIAGYRRDRAARSRDFTAQFQKNAINLNLAIVERERARGRFSDLPQAEGLAVVFLPAGRSGARIGLRCLAASRCQGSGVRRAVPSALSRRNKMKALGARKGEKDALRGLLVV